MKKMKIDWKEDWFEKDKLCKHRFEFVKSKCSCDDPEHCRHSIGIYECTICGIRKEKEKEETKKRSYYFTGEEDVEATITETVVTEGQPVDEEEG